MCAKRAPREYLSNQTQYFIQHKQLITGQVLGVHIWYKRHKLPLCNN